MGESSPASGVESTAINDEKSCRSMVGRSLAAEAGDLCRTCFTRHPLTQNKRRMTGECHTEQTFFDGQHSINILRVQLDVNQMMERETSATTLASIYNTEDVAREREKDRRDT